MRIPATRLVLSAVGSIIGTALLVTLIGQGTGQAYVSSEDDDVSRQGQGARLSPDAIITFSNPTPIAILDSGSAPSPANPYPSSINVSGVSGNVITVSVTINGFYHTLPDEVDMLLVGPGGQNAIIWSDAGGSAVPPGPLTITLDDAAANPLPDQTLLTSGTF